MMSSNDRRRGWCFNDRRSRRRLGGLDDFDLLLDEGYVSSSDLDLFTCVDDAEEIVSALERFYVNRAAGDGAT